MAGTAGCNHYFGSARAEAGRLWVGPLGSTLMACDPDAVMAQETRPAGGRILRKGRRPCDERSHELGCYW